ncbi:hypothetical protein [Sphingomonas sp.]|uniref:hypothetical protein n=1 Tax=Sphingomonas sp. TaxID=28214 RepID=UPI002D80389F|nr:hypothetical protein [Sphingomonas sp.]HEU0044033.1 hypothetical protein [Sphingomonas sp.]
MGLFLFIPLALLIFAVAIILGLRPLPISLGVPAALSMGLWLAALVALFINDGQWRFGVFGHVVARYWLPMLLFSLTFAGLGVAVRRLFSLVFSR